MCAAARRGDCGKCRVCATAAGFCHSRFARQMGKVCLVGCADLRIDEDAKQATLGQTRLSEGDPLCLGGDAGSIYADSPKITSERPVALIARFSEWRAHVLGNQ